MATAFQVNAFQNNAFQITVAPTPTGHNGGDDAGWTKEELRRIQKIQQKIAARQRLLEKNTKDANASRKQAFKDLIDPVAKLSNLKYNQNKRLRLIYRWLKQKIYNGL